MKNLFLKLSNIIVKYCFAIFCFIYAFANIFFTYWINNADYYEKKICFGLNVVNVILLLAILLFLYFLIKKDFFKIKEKNILISFLIICLAIGLFWIFTNDVVLR